MRNNLIVAVRLVNVLAWVERRIRRLRQRIEPAPSVPGALAGTRELFDRRDVRARW